MQTINVRETREKLSHLLDAVAAGEEVVILRHGKPVARLTGALPEKIQFPNRSELRASLRCGNSEMMSAIDAVLRYKRRSPLLPTRTCQR